jgi:hypothetical protein
MKTIIAILLAATLTACATPSQVQGYRPANYAGAPMQISGEWNELSSEITIFVDGQPALKGKVSPWTGTGGFSGQYQGYTISANCSINYYYRPKKMCTVAVNNEQAATLMF